MEPTDGSAADESRDGGSECVRDHSAGRREDDGVSRPAIAAAETSPNRTVFTEQGNPDGWIATDLTVETVR
ncbi:hypothetical protein ACERIT_02220 [Halopenitus sp. H-Gu1]|uniref:hypothetical protein n=1 Tax=Halopenitus sp. H-Gu1 TaxID=3242697 RepID=UPI00359D36F0